ncbi:uncharacterized protein BDZ83DRAFT_627044 [Colletotrichum acutatum]|uniref:Uncharacterized protein n=1 Tax=Glomerella acutata TaxID=27357 RepID=A0AAD8XFR9_GLOAC|nr:uncharacterized protein BDZ83DRAFT_627044 [Colletotrichum acutatum]KAK1723118.1 hypothetical protein BDZ83DRAFT_627044 [Colletotrichum acutatum]
MYVLECVCGMSLCVSSECEYLARRYECACRGPLGRSTPVSQVSQVKSIGPYKGLTRVQASLSRL